MRTRSLLVLLVLLPAYTQGLLSRQQSASTPTATYASTIGGLKQLLLDVRAAAKEGLEDKLATFLADMEVPDCDAWLHKMFDSDKADSWMDLCDAKPRNLREQEMKELFHQIAKQDGQIITRKVNDNPQPGKGLEWGLLNAIKQPLDIYRADWIPADKSGETGTDPIGYFMFIDGAFRWDSTIRTIKRSQITHATLPQPKLIKKVDAIYPPDAAARNVVGTVRVYYVIGGDGLVYNAHAISGEGLSDDPSLRKAAEEAVLQWRYEPRTFDGKPLQSAVTVDIRFVPNH
jgi:TonB family protein